MSSELISDNELYFHKDLMLTNADGYKCVKKIVTEPFEKLFTYKDPEFRKMTNYPIFLYMDDDNNYYCFSNNSLDFVKKNQKEMITKKNNIKIMLIKKYNSAECKDESIYKSDKLDNVDSCCKGYMKNIYNTIDPVVDYNIYRLKYDFLNDIYFDLVDVADLFLIYYNNFQMGANDLLEYGMKRENYKYACLTYDNNVSSNLNLQIDVGHQYRIHLLYLLGEHYELIKEQLVAEFLGGDTTLKSIIRLISNIKQGKNIGKDELYYLKKLSKIIDLFEEGFKEITNNHKKYNDTDVNKMIKSLEPFVIVREDYSEDEEKDEKKSEKSEKKNKPKKKTPKRKTKNTLKHKRF